MKEANTKELKENENLKELVKDGKFIVKFSAQWCQPCQSIKPIFEELSNDYNIIEVDVDTNEEASMQYGVRGIPTVLFIENSEVKNSKVGAVSKEEYITILKNLNF